MNSKVLDEIKERHRTPLLSSFQTSEAVYVDISFLVQSLELAWGHIEAMQKLDEQVREATKRIRDLLSSGGS